MTEELLGIVSHPRPALSYAQQEIWLSQTLSVGGIGDPHLPVAFRLDGRLDVPALERSLTAIFERHEVLQSTPGLSLELKRIEVCGASLAEKQTEALRLAAEEVRRPFDLERGPLIRAALLQLEDSAHLLWLTFHPLAADRGSLPVLGRELAAFYLAFSRGQAPAVSALPLQYSDYAERQRQRLEGPEGKASVEYWKKQLAGCAALPPVTDCAPPPTRSFRAGEEQLTLEAGLGDRLRRLGLEEGCPLSITLLAAFQLLLSRLSGSAEVAVAVSDPGRPHPPLEELIGCFSNALIIRTEVAAALDFRALLRRVRAGVVEAEAHNDVPLEKIVQELKPAGPLTRCPFTDVLFTTSKLAPIPGFELPELKVSLCPPPASWARYPLHASIEERAGAIEVSLVYQAELFAPERIRAMLLQFSGLLSQLAGDPAARVDQLSLLTPEARRRLPDPTRPLPVRWEGSIPERLSAQAQRAGEATAILDGDERWSYAELEARSNQLAHWLRAQGVHAADPVAIYAARSAGLVWAMLGILKARAAFVVLDPSYPERRLIDLLAAARTRGVLILEGAEPLGAGLEQFLAEGRAGVRLHLGRKAYLASPLAEQSTLKLPDPAGADDIAYLAFTSGTTGRPKGIIGTHRPLSHFLQWHAETFGLNSTDRFSMLGGLAHDPLLRDIFAPLWVGGSVCVPDPANLLSPAYLAEWMRASKISVSHLTPGISRLLAEGATFNQQTTSSLRLVCFGGEQLTRADVAAARAWTGTATCINFYGATETPQAIGYFEIPPGQEDSEQEPDRTRVPVGAGIEGAQLLVFNPAGQLAGPGELGELYVRTPYLSLGYLDDLPLTHARFLPNPATGASADRVYRTGDLARYRPDGAVVLERRADSQVKIRGFRVELQEIEAALAARADVGPVVVAVRQGPAGDQRLVAYVVARAPASLGVEELRAGLKKLLPEYMIPSAFVILPALPLTPNGKIDRPALPAPQWGGAEERYAAPRTPLEELLASLWAEVLGLERVGINDNFFEVGGDSLKAVRLLSRAREALDVALPLRSLYENGTVAGLAMQAVAARAVDGLEAAALSHCEVTRVPGSRELKQLPLSYTEERQFRWWQQSDDQMAGRVVREEVVWLVGPLDAGALAQAVTTLRRRHDLLRSTYLVSGEAVARQVPEQADFPLHRVDCRGLPDPEAAALRALEERFYAPFNLTSEPPLRIRLIQVAQERHLLSVGLDHIAADVRGVGLVLAELNSLYASFARGEPVEESTPALQYADFALWQRGLFSDPALLAAERSFWQTHLKGARPITRLLPTDYQRQGVDEPRAEKYLHGFPLGRVFWQVPPGIEAALKEVARKQNATLFAANFAAFAAMLARRAGVSEVVLSSLNDSRLRVLGLEGVPGAFNAPTLLRLSLAGAPAWSELIKRAQAEQNEIASRLEFPLIPLLYPRLNDLFRVVFNFIADAEKQELQWPGCRAEPLAPAQRPPPPGKTHLDLLFDADSTGGRLTYNAHLWSAQTAQRMIDDYLEILRQMATTPDALVS